MNWLVPWAGGVCCAAFFQGVWAAGYTLTDLGTLGGSESFAGAISDSKRVVGSSRLPGDVAIHTFFYQKGTVFDLSPVNSEGVTIGTFPAINNAGLLASGVVAGGVFLPALYDTRTGVTTLLGSLSSAAPFGFSGVCLGLNDAGQAVGYSYLLSGDRHAFLWSGGVMRDLGSLGGSSAARAINNRGTIVGFSSISRFGPAHAFVSDGQRMTDIDPFGGGESYAVDLNEEGEVVGFGLLTNQSAFHGFLLAHAQFIDLGVLAGGRNNWPAAINSRGQIVGAADVPIGVEIDRDPDTGEVFEIVILGPHAFLYDHGAMVDLNAALSPGSGWELEYATGINASGQIVGYGKLGDRFRAFLLTPHP